MLLGPLSMKHKPRSQEDKLYQQIVDGNYAFDALWPFKIGCGGVVEVAEWQRVGFEVGFARLFQGLERPKSW